MIVPMLLLVRHASAGARGSGPEDLARPLDARGLAQAAALPALLAPLLTSPTAPPSAPPIEIRSSPARRCMETVQPLATQFGTAVIEDHALVEGCDVPTLHDRLATLRGPAVWSSHGDVIPELLAMLARRGLDLGPAPRCSKGSTWVLDLVGGEVRTARYLPPPA